MKKTKKFAKKAIKIKNRSKSNLRFSKIAKQIIKKIILQM